MRGAVFRFILGTIALILVIDIGLHLVYKVHAYFCKNRLLDEYTDVPLRDSPPLSVRLVSLLVSIILNLLIYFIL